MRRARPDECPRRWTCMKRSHPILLEIIYKSVIAIVGIKRSKLGHDT